MLRHKCVGSAHRDSSSRCFASLARNDTLVLTLVVLLACDREARGAHARPANETAIDPAVAAWPLTRGNGFSFRHPAIPVVRLEDARASACPPRWDSSSDTAAVDTSAGEPVYARPTDS